MSASKSAKPVHPKLRQVAELKAAETQRVRAEFEQEARANIAAGKVWLCGEWVPKDRAGEISRQVRARGQRMFVEVVSVLVLLLILGVGTWVAVCFILTPYPPLNPRGKFAGFPPAEKSPSNQVAQAGLVAPSSAR